MASVACGSQLSAAEAPGASASAANAVVTTPLPLIAISVAARSARGPADQRSSNIWARATRRSSTRSYTQTFCSRRRSPAGSRTFSGRRSAEPATSAFRRPSRPLARSRRSGSRPSSSSATASCPDSASLGRARLSSSSMSLPRPGSRCTCAPTDRPCACERRAWNGACSATS